MSSRSSISQGLAALGANIGAAVSKATKTAKKSASKMSSKTIKKRPKQKMNSEASSLRVLANSIRREHPISGGMPRGVAYSRSHPDYSTVVPFKTPSVFLVTDSSGSLKFNTVGSGTSAILYMDINPINGVYGGSVGSGGPAYSNAMFGIGIARISGAFSQFRLRRLQFKYTTMLVPTATQASGLMTIGWARDPNFISGTAPTFAQASAINPSITFPPWAITNQVPPLVVPCHCGDDDWRYCATADNTSAMDRQTSYGTLIGAITGVPVPSLNTYFGVLEAEGEIELRGLFDTYDMNYTITRPPPPVADPTQVPTSSSSSSPSSSSSAPPCSCSLHPPLLSISETSDKFVVVKH
jgi:hypothetical protein